ncbi:MAG: hypothetical protein HUU54_07420 [Ignavibacteriaceae bacterium]|nr:hypothetical protein [Ignavibacteriaceae bacterium]
MKSWSSWISLTATGIRSIPINIAGVYTIRVREIIPNYDSDIIYMGKSKDISRRLKGLLDDLNNDREKWKGHSSSQKIKLYKKHGLEFSFIQVSKNSDGVEKALLLAFHCSNGRLPLCNRSF